MQTKKQKQISAIKRMAKTYLKVRNFYLEPDEELKKFYPLPMLKRAERALDNSLMAFERDHGYRDRIDLARECGLIRN